MILESVNFLEITCSHLTKEKDLSKESKVLKDILVTDL